MGKGESLSEQGGYGAALISGKRGSSLLLDCGAAMEFGPAVKKPLPRSLKHGRG